MSRRLTGRVHKLELSTRTVDLRAMSDEQLMDEAVREALRCDKELIVKALSPAADAKDALGNPIDIGRAIEEQNGDHIRRVLDLVQERGAYWEVMKILQQEIGRAS